LRFRERRVSLDVYLLSRQSFIQVNSADFTGDSVEGVRMPTFGAFDATSSLGFNPKVAID